MLRCKLNNACSTTAEILNSLDAAFTPAATTLAGHHLIQLTRDLGTATAADVALKQQLKDGISMLVSMANTLVMSHEMLAFIIRAFSAGVWSDLTMKEKISLGVLLAAGTATASYSIWKFGVEQQTYAAGFSATASTALFGFATNIINYAKRRLDHTNERTNLFDVRYN